MNILTVVGSGHRNGITEQLSNAFNKGAIESGHDVTKIVLTGSLSGCQGCLACQKNGNHCVINDEMQNYYELFLKADMIVFASPLYFWSISGRLKSFIDRLYAISKDDKYPFKKTALLMSAGDDGFYTFHQASSFYHFYTNALNWEDMGSVLAGGCDNSINEKYLEEAYQLGLKVKS